MSRKQLMIAALGATMLAACGGDDDPTVMNLVNDQIVSNTTESALPIQINDLPVSDNGTDETSLPQPI